MLPLVAMVALVAVVMSEPAPSWAEVAVSRQRRGGCSTCYNNCCRGTCVQNECQVEEANATADKMEEEGSRHA